jgi:hypothetical protein
MSEKAETCYEFDICESYFVLLCVISLDRLPDAEKPTIHEITRKNTNKEAGNGYWNIKWLVVICPRLGTSLTSI